MARTERLSGARRGYRPSVRTKGLRRVFVARTVGKNNERASCAFREIRDRLDLGSESREGDFVVLLSHFLFHLKHFINRFSPLVSFGPAR